MWLLLKMIHPKCKIKKNNKVKFKINQFVNKVKYKLYPHKVNKNQHK